MKRFRCLFGPPGEQGSIAPIVALGLLAFVGFLALGIDLGQLYVVKNELQNAADGAALAAAKKLVQDKNNDGVAEVYCDEAITAAVYVAAQNRSFGAPDPIKITAADVIIGKWDLSAKAFTSQGCSANPMMVNAVQVRVRRTGEDNPRVTTFLGGLLGGGSQKDVTAYATAYLGLAGTSSVDIPFAVPVDYANGGGVASNGWQRLLDRFGPTPAYAATKSYRFYDKADGGTSSNPNLGSFTNRATWAVAKQEEASPVQAYNAMQKYLLGTVSYPQKQVGDKLYPVTDHTYGQYLKKNFDSMKTRWNTEKNPSTGKWRVTVPVYSPTPVTAALPQNSWLKLASRLLPGVSQAHACTVMLTPVVYTQGFLTIDITNVYVNSNCNQVNNGTAQKNDPNSCRNTCYMEFDVPLDQNTVSSDKGSNPVPCQKSYKDMNSAASEVGVFAATPRIVK